MKNILLIIVLLGGLSLIAQTTPQFEFPIYCSDALGNKDTIYLGYHPDALSGSNGFINLEFGEEAIDTPFDSIFEVRIANHFNDFEDPRLKRKF